MKDFLDLLDTNVWSVVAIVALVGWLVTEALRRAERRDLNRFNEAEAQRREDVEAWSRRQW